MVRGVFLSTAGVARELIASPSVGTRWDDPSALDRMSIGALAAHLARAVLTLQQYMALPLPEEASEPLTAAQYFAAALTSDLDDDLNRGIRTRSNEGAAAGQDGVLANLDAALASVTASLDDAPADAQVAVFGVALMSLDEYLVTRLLELVLHLDDLAVSLGVDTPEIDSRAVDLVTQCFVGVARIRNGDVAVIRALARRERAPATVFPVF
ncbi:MAG TPA: maleylpyruvate isomerase N-terminal domain-containing protein [Acidimicrobiia bacterium]|jgi:hypothetical protein